MHYINEIKRSCNGGPFICRSFDIEKYTLLDLWYMVLPYLWCTCFFLVGEVYIANCMYFPGNHLQHGGRHAVHINIKL